MQARERVKESSMEGVFVLAAIIIAWFVLNRYVLPRLGVKT
jgi:hypothetical protein